jgi:hypothetical protein
MCVSWKLFGGEGKDKLRNVISQDRVIGVEVGRREEGVCPRGSSTKHTDDLDALGLHLSKVLPHLGEHGVLRRIVVEMDTLVVVNVEGGQEKAATMLRRIPGDEVNCTYCVIRVSSGRGET